jgi:hypothetical protein
MLLVLACSDVAVTGATTSTPTGDNGGVGPGGNGSGGAGAGGALSGGGGASVAPLHLGVVANPASGGEPRVLAELRSFAAGVRLVGVELSFRGFDEQDLEARLAGYAEKNLRVVVTLLVVDRQEAHRPPELPQAPWNGAAMKAALDAAVAAIEEVGVGVVDAIALGRGVDSFIAAHPAEGAELAELLKLTAEAGGAVPRGIGLSHPLSASPTAASLAAAGQVLVASYFPGIGSASLSAAAAAQDLDAIAQVAGVRPVLLLEVGFSSAHSLGASETSQLERFDAFLSALGPRRARFPWLLVHQLHDLDDAACDDLAARQGEDSTGPWAAYLCHTGLRTALGEPKPTWGRFLEAAAMSATP